MLGKGLPSFHHGQQGEVGRVGLCLHIIGHRVKFARVSVLWVRVPVGTTLASVATMLEGMPVKLFLMWLLGVPLLVTSMVMAQAISGSNAASPQCSGQLNLHSVKAPVLQQRNGVSCDRSAVH